MNSANDLPIEVEDRGLSRLFNVQVLKYVEVLPHALDVNVNVKYAFEDATEISVSN
jgi:hypothetical protein